MTLPRQRRQPHISGIHKGTSGPSPANNTNDTDTEHTIHHYKPHDSAPCAADPDTKDEFTSDLLNLTLASPSVNRHQKSGKDPTEWLPDPNQCWYVDRIVQVGLEYGLTSDEPRPTTSSRLQLDGDGRAGTKHIRIHHRHTKTHPETRPGH